MAFKPVGATNFAMDGATFVLEKGDRKYLCGISSDQLGALAQHFNFTNDSTHTTDHALSDLIDEAAARLIKLNPMSEDVTVTASDVLGG